MGRNTELIRQWTLLQWLAASRSNTIPKVADDLNVTTRTIRRDLEALQTAGFPIYDETVNGSKFWRMDSRSLGGTARSGLTFSELASLYFSRALIECFAGTAMLGDLQSGLDKFEAALSAAMKKFLDRLLKDRSDGSVVMTLQVSDDYALRNWILGFGRLVRVQSPAALVEWVEEELDQARQQYAAGAGVHVVDSDAQPGLPFPFNQLATA